jgi:hypothetical protein
MVFNRLRLLLAAVVVAVVIRNVLASTNGSQCGRVPDERDDEACKIDCIVCMSGWTRARVELELS